MEEFVNLLQRMNLNSHDTSGTSFDPARFAQLKAESYNKSEGNLPGYACPKCKNRGNFMVVREDGTSFFRDCGCLVTRRCLDRMEASGLRNVIRDMTFDRFHVLEPWQEKIKKTAQSYADNPTGWLLFCGQPGCGKTHLCTAVARKLLLEGREVVYMPWREESSRIKAMDGERRAEAVKKLQRSEILYIDDLFKVGRSADGSTVPTAADIGLAFEILNNRYVNRMPTIISTEKSVRDLLDIDEALGSRIVEMSRDSHAVVAKDDSRNWRLQGMAEV